MESLAATAATTTGVAAERRAGVSAREVWASRGRIVALTGMLAAAAVAVHGYHPYAEDGGVYVPGVKWLLRPSLYPEGRAFVTSPMQLSVFAPVMAWAVRASGAGLEPVLLGVHVLSFWAMLGAGWSLAWRSFRRTPACVGAVLLLAAWMTMPVAGTSLMLMDPYVTARSFSTPLTILALAGAVEAAEARGDRRRRGFAAGLALGCLVLAAAMHPLMAAYGIGCALVLGCLLAEGRTWRWGAGALCVAAVGVAAAVNAWWPEAGGPAALRAVVSRPYWFPGRWRWFELLGLLGPLLILAVAGFGRGRWSRTSRALARMAVLCGGTATAVALVYARAGAASHAVARLQPLRVFAVVYVVMIVGLGALLGEWLGRRKVWVWVASFAVLAGALTVGERRAYRSSPHLELPGGVAVGGRANGWEAAFRWIRENTPEDAAFALPADYVGEPGEDAEGFRAVAERSALADFSKDGGEAAIRPALAAEWARDQDGVAGLGAMSDGERVRRMRALGAGWILLLPRDGPTGLQCPYQSAAVRVCRVP